tara:strand:- start:6061 stop:6363 length:303 start_codon:yes stop_codon:yes gene_type:complete
MGEVQKKQLSNISISIDDSPHIQRSLSRQSNMLNKTTKLQHPNKNMLPEQFNLSNTHVLTIMSMQPVAQVSMSRLLKPAHLQKTKAFHISRSSHLSPNPV